MILLQVKVNNSVQSASLVHVWPPCPSFAWRIFLRMWIAATKKPHRQLHSKVKLCVFLLE